MKRVYKERIREDFLASSLSSEDDWLLLLTVSLLQLLTFGNFHHFVCGLHLYLNIPNLLQNISFLNLHSFCYWSLFLVMEFFYFHHKAYCPFQDVLHPENGKDFDYSIVVRCLTDYCF